MILAKTRKLLAGATVAGVILAFGFAYAQQGPRGKTSYMPVDITEPFSAMFARLSAQQPDVTREHMVLLNERYDLGGRPASRWTARNRCRTEFASRSRRERRGKLLRI